jgi:hypothetical protein
MIEESTGNCDEHKVNVIMLIRLHNVQHYDNTENIPLNNNKLNFSQSNRNVFLNV